VSLREVLGDVEQGRRCGGGRSEVCVKYQVGFSYIDYTAAVVDAEDPKAAVKAARRKSGLIDEPQLIEVHTLDEREVAVDPPVLVRYLDALRAAERFAALEKIAKAHPGGQLEHALEQARKAVP
jgi:hypothetical protein